MVSLTSVAELHGELAGRNVLSVYITADEHDPTERSSWRTRLNGGLDRVQNGLDGTSAVEFRAARNHVETEFSRYDGFLPGRGWTAFATAEGLHHCSAVAARMPDLVRWRRGPAVGPWLRALKQERPVMIALLDSRRARLLRYQAGELSEHVDYRSDEFIDDLADRTMSKRAAMHSGVRGETATDAADRIMKTETDRLLKLVAGRLREAGPAVPIIAGGAAAATAALQKLLGDYAGARVHVESSLYVTMSLPEIKAVIEPIASMLARQLQVPVVQDILEQAGASARGILGRIGSSSAAERGQVELLLLTPRFIDEHGDDAEDLITLVLERGGAVDVVTADAADLLDSRGSGVAARLRYVRQSQTEGAITPA
jgi:hypothetical protein